MRYLEAQEIDGHNAVVLADGVKIGTIYPLAEGDFRIDTAGVVHEADQLGGASPRDAWNHLLGAVRAGHIEDVVVGEFKDLDVGTT